jgi:hypothetical protein
MSYGRNFEFRVTPRQGERGSRFFLDDVERPIGVPVVVGSPVAIDDLGRTGVELKTGATAKPRPGMGGILVYERIQPTGRDPYENTFSDYDTAPAGAAVQVVNGTTVKVAFKNTEDTGFLTRTGYPKARTMVDEIGATVGVSVGSMLTPGAGTDADGYWAITTNADNAWLIVTSVNTTTGEVEARLNF